MRRWTNSDLADIVGVCRQTFSIYVKQFIRQRKFQKKSPGKFYLMEDVEKLGDLMGFSLYKAKHYLKEKERSKEKR